MLVFEWLIVLSVLKQSRASPVADEPKTTHQGDLHEEKSEADSMRPKREPYHDYLHYLIDQRAKYADQILRPETLPRPFDMFVLPHDVRSPQMDFVNPATMPSGGFANFALFPSMYPPRKHYSPGMQNVGYNLNGRIPYKPGCIERSMNVKYKPRPKVQGRRLGYKKLKTKSKGMSITEGRKANVETKNLNNLCVNHGMKKDSQKTNSTQLVVVNFNVNHCQSEKDVKSSAKNQTTHVSSSQCLPCLGSGRTPILNGYEKSKGEKVPVHEEINGRKEVNPKVEDHMTGYERLDNDKGEYGNINYAKDGYDGKYEKENKYNERNRDADKEKSENNDKKNGYDKSAINDNQKNKENNKEKKEDENEKGGSGASIEQNHDKKERNKIYIKEKNDHEESNEKRKEEIETYGTGKQPTAKKGAQEAPAANNNVTTSKDNEQSKGEMGEHSKSKGQQDGRKIGEQVKPQKGYTNGNEEVWETHEGKETENEKNLENKSGTRKESQIYNAMNETINEKHIAGKSNENDTTEDQKIKKDDKGSNGENSEGVTLHKGEKEIAEIEKKTDERIHIQNENGEESDTIKEQHGRNQEAKKEKPDNETLIEKAKEEEQNVGHTTIKEIGVGDEKLIDSASVGSSTKVTSGKSETTSKGILSTQEKSENKITINSKKSEEPKDMEANKLMGNMQSESLVLTNEEKIKIKNKGKEVEDIDKEFETMGLGKLIGNIDKSDSIVLSEDKELKTKELSNSGNISSVKSGNKTTTTSKVMGTGEADGVNKFIGNIQESDSMVLSEDKETNPNKADISGNMSTNTSLAVMGAGGDFGNIEKSKTGNITIITSKVMIDNDGKTDDTRLNKFVGNIELKVSEDNETMPKTVSSDKSIEKQKTKFGTDNKESSLIKETLSAEGSQGEIRHFQKSDIEPDKFHGSISFSSSVKSEDGNINVENSTSKLTGDVLITSKDVTQGQVNLNHENSTSKIPNDTLLTQKEVKQGPEILEENLTLNKSSISSSLDPDILLKEPPGEAPKSEANFTISWLTQKSSTAKGSKESPSHSSATLSIHEDFPKDTVDIIQVPVQNNGKFEIIKLQEDPKATKRGSVRQEIEKFFVQKRRENMEENIPEINQEILFTFSDSNPRNDEKKIIDTEKEQNSAKGKDIKITSRFLEDPEENRIGSQTASGKSDPQTSQKENQDMFIFSKTSNGQSSDIIEDNSQEVDAQKSAMSGVLNFPTAGHMNVEDSALDVQKTETSSNGRKGLFITQFSGTGNNFATIKDDNDQSSKDLKISKGSDSTDHKKLSESNVFIFSNDKWENKPNKNEQFSNSDGNLRKSFAHNFDGSTGFSNTPVAQDSPILQTVVNNESSGSKDFTFATEKWDDSPNKDGNFHPANGNLQKLFAHNFDNTDPDNQDDFQETEDAEESLQPLQKLAPFSMRSEKKSDIISPGSQTASSINRENTVWAPNTQQFKELEHNDGLKQKGSLLHGTRDENTKVLNFEFDIGNDKEFRKNVNSEKLNEGSSISSSSSSSKVIVDHNQPLNGFNHPSSHSSASTFHHSNIDKDNNDSSSQEEVKFLSFSIKKSTQEPREFSTDWKDIISENKHFISFPTEANMLLPSGDDDTNQKQFKAANSKSSLHFVSISTEANWLHPSEKDNKLPKRFDVSKSTSTSDSAKKLSWILNPTDNKNDENDDPYFFSINEGRPTASIIIKSDSDDKDTTIESEDTKPNDMAGTGTSFINYLRKPKRKGPFSEPILSEIYPRNKRRYESPPSIYWHTVEPKSEAIEQRIHNLRPFDSADFEQLPEDFVSVSKECEDEDAIYEENSNG
ncbi:uncharacterized protein PF3D7_1120600-like [Musca vetustissima]|uniref:uncharacterized protein PF3D7_1120600-like n=1 Tax=Musca vetustissima TaxID=27455 RepID=UPI002AB6F388|nr:uncharacterized protein PF3D7_1120600-like [Musca vetustissima]